MSEDTDRKNRQSKTIKRLEKIVTFLGMSQEELEQLKIEQEDFPDRKDIRYKGNGTDFITVGIFFLITIGVFSLIMMVTGLRDDNKILYEQIVRYSQIVIILIYAFIVAWVRIIIIEGDSKRFVVWKGMLSPKANRISIRIKDVVEWKKTKLPWTILLKQHREGRSGYVERGTYKAVELWLRDGLTIIFRCQKPLEFFAYLQEMKSLK